jgi:hypothetical protein
MTRATIRREAHNPHARSGGSTAAELAKGQAAPSGRTAGPDRASRGNVCTGHGQSGGHSDLLVEAFAEYNSNW